MISLNDSDGSYVQTRWQGMLFYWAILVYSLVVNLCGSKPLSMMNSASGKQVSRMLPGIQADFVRKVFFTLLGGWHLQSSSA
jgi:hypothetical protein